MSDKTDNLLGLLGPFGLTQEEARIYLELLEKRMATALGLSRSLHIGRTKVYRILDKLIEKELVIQQLDSGGFKFVASEPKQLELLLTKKEAELMSLKKTLPQVVGMLQTKVDSGKSGSKILYYRGQEGLSQVNWNMLRKKIMVRTLTNRTHQKPYTKVVEMVKNWWQLRHIPKSVLEIRADVFIYNNVYAVCNFLDGGDVFCFEIYNENVAQMQREIFEELWKKAKLMSITDQKGGMKLVE